MDIIRRYAERDARIKIISQDNAGAGAARNAGIEASSYKFLTFVDADDVIDYAMYEKMIAMQNITSVDCVCCDALVKQADGSQGELRTIYDDNRIYHREEISDMIASLVGFSTASTDGMCSLWNKLFITRIIKDNNIHVDCTRTHGEDWLFCIEYFRLCNSICFIHECLYHYIHRSTRSLVNRYRENYFEIAIRDRMYFTRLFPEFNWNSQEKINEWKQLPIRSVLYYRNQGEKNSLRDQIKKVFNLCQIYSFYDENDIEFIYCELRKALSNNDFAHFYKLMIFVTNKDRIMYLLKKAVKALWRNTNYIRRWKNGI